MSKAMTRRGKISEAGTMWVGRRSKYGAVRTVINGIPFDSKAEARRYGELKLIEQAGGLAKLEIHPVFKIKIDGVLICRVVLDFCYWNCGRLIYEDVKGRDNALSKLKRKLVEAQYGIKVKLIKYGRG